LEHTLIPEAHQPTGHAVLDKELSVAAGDAFPVA
jgi:hypothetical protein